MRALLIFGIASLLSGCGVTRSYNANEAAEQSLAIYKACLAQHPDDFKQTCEAARLAWEADKAEYERVRLGGRPAVVVQQQSAQ